MHTRARPTRSVFFTHAALTRSAYGNEILPVFWDDNYFSLLPGESKVVCAKRSGEPINNGLYMVRSTMLAIPGRMVSYTG